MRRGRLWSYLRWQARDFVTERGTPLLIVAMLMWGPFIVTLRRMHAAMQGLPQASTGAVSAIIDVFSTFAIISVLIGINGVVSNDRVRGYYRFLFAKPVSIPRYYAQAYVVNGIGLIVTAAAVLASIYAIGHSLFLVRALWMVALAYVSLGGLGFLFSTLVRFDWILMGATLGLAHALRLLFPAHGSRGGKVLHVILPPFHELSNVGQQLARGEPPDSSMLLWLVGWGVSAFVLGLLILRRRPLAA
jgi:hypothetical protein